MEVYYSRSTGGFYVRSIHGEDIPNDAVAITAEDHAALLDGQSQGKKISADGNGCPILIDPPQPTDDELSKAAVAFRDALLAQAAIGIVPLQDAVDLGIATVEEESGLLEWKRYRVALNRLDLSVHPVAWPTKPEQLQA